MNFDIIYELSQGVRQVMEKVLAPESVRKILGKARVLVIFRTERNRQIIGGKLISGEVKKGVSIEVFRGGEEKIGQGKLVNLQRNKKDIDRCLKGEECGILFEGDVKIEQRDTLVFYTEEKKKSEL